MEFTRKDGFQLLSTWIIRLLFCLYLILSTIKLVGSFSFITVLQIVLFGIYFFDVLTAIRKKGPLWYGTLFLYSFFLFLLSRIFLDFINIQDMYRSDRFAWYTISDNTTAIILVSYILFLSVFLVFICRSKNEHSKYYGLSRFKFASDLKLEKITSTILLITMPIAIVYEMYIGLTRANYLSNFLIDSSLPTFVSLIVYLGEYTIPVYFCSLPQKHNRKIIYVLIGLFYLSQTILGQRSVILLAGSFFLWYELSVGKTVNTGKIVSVAISLFVLTIVVTFLRESSSYFSNQNIIVKMLYSSGGTHMVFANYIDYRDKILNDTPLYFLSGIIQPVNRYFINSSAFTGGRNAIMAASSFALDHKLMYALAPAAFESGRGFGSNFITEMWACGGYIGVVIIGYIYLQLVKYVEKKSYKSRIWFIVQFYLIQEFIWSPRGTLFPNFILVTISIILYLFYSQIRHRE